MHGFFLGAAFLLLAVGLAKWTVHAHLHGRRERCGGHGRRGGRGRHGEGFARAAGEVFKRRLRIDDDQEGIVDHALRDVRAALTGLKDELKDSRADLAGAFRGESVDDAALAAAFHRHDEAVTRARREVVSALKQIHAVLDDEQRARAADWLAAADGRWP